MSAVMVLHAGVRGDDGMTIPSERIEASRGIVSKSIVRRARYS